MDDLLFGLDSPFFTGTVTEAIEQAKKQDCLLVVYLFDPSSPVSESLEQTCWNDVLLVDQMRKQVAIRLSSSSVEFSQFCQLFKVGVCPSVCFISSKGELLQTISEKESLTASGIGHAMQLLLVKKTIEKRRLEKLEEEEKLKQGAEIKRREDAKGIADARKAVDERRLAIEASKTREAQEASRRHRDEVVNKVRMERQERLGRSQENVQSAPSAAAPVSAVAPAAPGSSGGRHAKIKFVIGDTTTSHTFAASDTLGAMRAFVTSQGYSGFTLETVFPRRILAANQDGRTLEALGLTPACAIVVSLAPNAVLQSVGGSFYAAAHPVTPAPSNARGTVGAPGSVAASGTPTIHPNVDTTYIHPNDSNSFLNSILNTVWWVTGSVSSLCRSRPRPVPEAQQPAAPARRGQPPPRTRPGGYEELQQDL